MQKIASQEQLERIHRAGRGFIYNDFTGTEDSPTTQNLLHTADCEWVESMTLGVPKYYSESFSEAAAWLGQNRGKENVNWKCCLTCRPGSSGPEATSGPFTESLVEELLIAWLRKSGYLVQTQVPAPSGIIDIVVGGKESEWIIEVKGEDKGGYGTAQMNFQQGLGQLLSRMTDASKKYALAIPVTEDYRQVLEKYRGTFGAELLGIYFLTVGRNGSVNRFEGFEIDRMLEWMGNRG